MTILEMEIEVLRLENELHDAKQRLHDAKITASGVAVGDVVIGTNRHSGTKFKVVEIDTRWTPPWLIGNPIRKDGTFGTARRNLYDYWEKS